MNHFSQDENSTKEIAKNITKSIILGHPNGPVFVGLVGELGAGKTTFMKGVAEFFGVEGAISSPTFVIQKIYEIPNENRQALNHSFKKLIHIDMYRLEDEKELAAIDWQNYKNDKDNIIFVEWPNQIWQEFPEDMIQIKIQHGEDENIRKIIY